MFSQKLKELRLTRGYTQKQIADELQFSQQAYQAWEKGKREPTLSTINMFANFFNIPIAQLLDDKVSLDYLLSADTFTYKDETLSESQVADLKDKIRQVVGD